MRKHVDVSPGGRFIVLVGPDGSGKSTISARLIDALAADLVPLNFRPRRVDRWLGKRPASAGAEVAPHHTASRLDLRTWFKFVMIVLDLATVGWDVMRSRRTGQPFIAERYVYDLLADPKRLGLERIPRPLRSVAVRMAATPDRVYCLVGSAALMHDRKPELPLVEVDRQVTFWRAYAKGRPRFACVDTTGISIGDLVQTILDDLRSMP